MLQRGGEVIPTTIYLSQRVVAGGLPRVAPDGLVQRGVRFIKTPLESEGQAQVVIRLSIAGVGIPADEPPDRSSEMLLRGGEISPAQMSKSQGIVAASVVRIDPQRLLPVRLGVHGGMSILL